VTVIPIITLRDALREETLIALAGAGRRQRSKARRMWCDMTRGRCVGRGEMAGMRKELVVDITAAIGRPLIIWSDRCVKDLLEF